MKLLACTALFSIGIPVGARAYVQAKTHDLADHLGAASGVTAAIGNVDVDLTAKLRLSDVRLGELFAADAIEASVALDSLLSGQLGADEIRVAGPRVELEIDRNGDSDLAQLVRRLANKAPRTHSDTKTRLRRIVVSSGSLVAHVPGLGEVTADGVELVPDAGGVRVITGPLHVEGTVGHGTRQLHGELTLARSSAEVSLPHVKFGRVLAVAGAGEVSTTSGQHIPLRDVSIGRLHAGGNLDIRAALDDGGLPRHLGAEIAPPTADGELAVTLQGDHVPLRAFASLAPHGVLLDDAHASGSITIDRKQDHLALTIDGSLDGARIDHKLAGAIPVAVAGTMKGTVTLEPGQLTADHVVVGIGAQTWTATGLVKRGAGAPHAELDLALATAPCNDLLNSLPTEIRGPLDGMTMSGELGGRAHLGLDLGKPAGEGVDLDLDLDNRCTVTVEPPAADVAQLAVLSDQVFADGSHGKVGRGAPGFAELRSLPGYLPAAFVSAEDARFYEHHGFDTTQIGKSLEIDLRDGKLARGGSTISQQLVKNAFLSQRRALDRKLDEAILTWRLESRLDKRTILERYLNIIELGPHVFGVGAAAKFWFDQPASTLDLKQAAFLAALTSEPKSMARRIRHANGIDNDSAARVDVILYAMFRDGVIDQDSLQRARAMPLHFSAAALKGD
ncbi:MAG: transglycosylase domain-containing protein [Kofleriaceae bacterium]